MASRSSSERRPTWRRLRASLVSLSIASFVLASGSLVSGCVTVRPEEKEFLAQPAMTYGADETRGHDEHVFSNREGAFGAGGVSGGGCGCN